ncbi:MAG TPA: DNA polymerase III subunit beta [Candidatus Babeliales bacterium]|nr:DNA polymerase III subunit beta [Candidatus Babeliales bacterium]
MKNTFIVEQKPLLSILSSMQPICTKRTTLDATTTILFHVGHKELVLKSTDLEISLQASYLLKECDIDEPRLFLVSGRRLFDLVKELEGDITFILDDTSLLVKAGLVNVVLNIQNAQNFPPFPERIENLMQLSASFLLELLNKVSFLIPQNNANSSLNGLFLEISESELKMTASDGHCLAQVQTSVYTLEDPHQWLLPRRAIFEVKKILESSSDTTVFLGLCGNQLVFSGESFNFFSKLLVNVFPAYETILNKKDFIPARVERSHFIKTLRRSSCLLSGQFIATNFAFGSEKLKVSLHNKEVGTLEEEVPLFDFTGAECDIRFYAPYLLNGLQVFPDEQIQFYLQGKSKPIIFDAYNKSEGNEYAMFYLVMPVAQAQE